MIYDNNNILQHHHTNNSPSRNHEINKSIQVRRASEIHALAGVVPPKAPPRRGSTTPSANHTNHANHANPRNSGVSLSAVGGGGIKHGGTGMSSFQEGEEGEEEGDHEEGQYKDQEGDHEEDQYKDQEGDHEEGNNNIPQKPNKPERPTKPSHPPAAASTPGQRSILDEADSNYNDIRRNSNSNSSKGDIDLGQSQSRSQLPEGGRASEFTFEQMYVIVLSCLVLSELVLSCLVLSELVLSCQRID